MAYAEYERSAIDLISPMLTVNQQAREDIRYRQKDFWDKTQAGLKQIGDSVSAYMRHRKVEYVGDNKLNEMKAHLEELKRELEMVNNHIKTIKAEDTGSLDTFVNTPTVHNAEQDVNDYSVDGGRFSSTRIDTYDDANEFEPSEEDFSHPAAYARENIPPEVKAKYKVGLRALGGR